MNPDLLTRWAAERRLLAYRAAEATARRRRTALWIAFVVGCLAVIALCVVALVGPGAATGNAPRRPVVTTGSSPAPP